MHILGSILNHFSSYECVMYVLSYINVLHCILPAYGIHSFPFFMDNSNTISLFSNHESKKTVLCGVKTAQAITAQKPCY